MRFVVHDPRSILPVKGVGRDLGSLDDCEGFLKHVHTIAVRFTFWCPYWSLDDSLPDLRFNAELVAFFNRCEAVKELKLELQIDPDSGPAFDRAKLLRILSSTVDPLKGIKTDACVTVARKDPTHELRLGDLCGALGA